MAETTDTYEPTAEQLEVIRAEMRAEIEAEVRAEAIENAAEKTAAAAMIVDSDLEDDDEYDDAGETPITMVNPSGRQVDVPERMVAELVGKGFVYAQGQKPVAGVPLPLGQQHLAANQINAISDGSEDDISADDSPEIAASKRKIAEVKRKKRRG